MDNYSLQQLQIHEHHKELFLETLTRCNDYTIKYIKRSKLYKFLNINLNMILIVCETTLGLILAIERQDYVSASIAFLTALVHGILLAFKINSLGIEYRLAGTRTNALARRLTQASCNPSTDIEDIDRLVNDVMEELDDISLHLFSQSYGPSDRAKLNDHGDISEIV